MAIVLALVALCVLGKVKSNKKMLNFGSFFLGIIGVQVFFGPIFFALQSHSYASLIIPLVLLTSIILITQLGLKRHKAKLDVHNGELRVQMNDTYQQIQTTKEELLSFSGSWYPRDYYYSDAVEHFISYMLNHQSTTIEKMVDLYVDEQRHQETMQRFDRLDEKMDDIVGNQQEMMKLLRVNNVLSTISAVANITTALNTGDIARNTSTIAGNTSNISGNMDALARKFRAK